MGQIPVDWNLSRWNIFNSGLLGAAMKGWDGVLFRDCQGLGRGTRARRNMNIVFLLRSECFRLCVADNVPLWSSCDLSSLPLSIGTNRRKR